MRSQLPKVLHPLRGKPLISHVIDSIRLAGISDIVLVIGYMGEKVIESIGNSVDFVWQREQLGTGHAVLQAESKFADFRGSLLVACGDVPLIKPSTFKKLINSAQKKGVGASVLTMNREDPAGYGRIIKDGEENLIRIVEERDSTPEEKKINEVNTGTYVFNKDLLFSGLKTLGTDNVQGEYYLPDVLQYIRGSGCIVNTVLLEESIEGSGVNSKEELQRLEDYLSSKTE